MDCFEPDAHFLAKLTLAHTYTYTQASAGTRIQCQTLAEWCSAFIFHLIFLLVCVVSSVWRRFSPSADEKFAGLRIFLCCCCFFLLFFLSSHQTRRMATTPPAATAWMPCHTKSHVLSEYARIYPPNHDILWVGMCVCDCVQCRTLRRELFTWAWLCVLVRSPWKPIGFCCSHFVLCVLVCVFVWVCVKLNAIRAKESDSHHQRVVSTVNFSLEKGFFIAVTRQLSPAKRHAHQTVHIHQCFIRDFIVYRIASCERDFKNRFCH